MRYDQVGRKSRFRIICPGLLLSSVVLAEGDDKFGTFMLHTFAVSGYRSLKDNVLCLGQLNVVTGPNGSGKSSLYRALHMISATANGRLIQSLAREGGLQSTLWAGPERFSRQMLEGDVPVQGTVRKKPISLRLGFSSCDFSYSIDLGLPSHRQTAFSLDPIIKRECLWRGPSRQARDLVADRKANNLRIRPHRKWEDVKVPLSTSASMLTEFADPERGPELILLRESIRSWRFYDHFRTDVDAPVRQVQIGTFTPVLSSKGNDLAAALQTIRESGHDESLHRAIRDAFPGSQLSIRNSGEARFELFLSQDGMLRPLRSAELSDGTLRFLLLAAALLTPQPPELMVLNEPETSLHPDLLPALGRLIIEYAQHNQILVVTHALPLIKTLTANDQCEHFQLEKMFGATRLVGVDDFDLPNWEWPKR